MARKRSVRKRGGNKRKTSREVGRKMKWTRDTGEPSERFEKIMEEDRKRKERVKSNRM